MTSATRLALGRLAVLLVAACGDGSPAHDDASAPHDTGPVMTLPPCTPAPGTAVTARKLADRTTGAAMLVTAPTDDDRLFVVEQRGAIRIYEAERIKPAPFLDLSAANHGPVVAGGELGLLGLAFHPRFADNGEFYVFYTADNPASGGDPYVDVLARYHVSVGDPNLAEPTGAIVLSIPDPFSNHNGGMIEFGADGYLYISTGDGGDHGDPRRNAQNPDALLGKFLRIDVDHRAPGQEYGIPADNPFAAGGGAPEVFILGVRNAWRWSFDRATGDMWIGDVGQGVTEEIDVLKAGEQAGKNLGWSAYEGDVCCATQGDKCTQSGAQQACDPAGKTFPLDNRRHGDGWLAIIGGQVYRGRCYPELVGWYLYTDNSRGTLSKAQLRPDGTLAIIDVPGAFVSGPASIHADGHGELWATDVGGNVYHLDARP